MVRFHTRRARPARRSSFPVAGVHGSASVLITGAGPMGMILLQLVRRGGAARVFVSEPDADWRRLALRLGAETAIDPTEQRIPDEVRQLTDGAGAAVAFETAGLAAPLARTPPIS
jgi:threonine dehydrogenase-like Zn-dependent dehydrogenase